MPNFCSEVKGQADGRTVCRHWADSFLVVVCRMALKYYEDNDVAADDVFKLPVPSAAISTHLNKYACHAVIVSTGTFVSCVSRLTSCHAVVLIGRIVRLARPSVCLSVRLSVSFRHFWPQRRLPAADPKC